MKEISVTVYAPGSRIATYRFAQTPLSIGRSPGCHISICHESVPRKLCKAWLEADGRTIRVEERPGLSNPLMMGDRIVKGGVSGKSLTLSVGPVRLFLEAGPAESPSPKPSRKNRLPLLAAASLLLVLACAAQYITSKSNDPFETEGLPNLPSSPFDSSTSNIAIGEDISTGKADILASRARELLTRPGEAVDTKVLAARLMLRSAKIASALGDRTRSQYSAEAMQIKTEVDNAYRAEALRLKRQIERKETSLASATAQRLLQYLGPGGDRPRRWLAHLANEKTGAKEAK